MFDIPDVKRRSAPRRMARIRCEAVSAEGFVPVGGTIRDLSDTGVLLESDVSLAAGEELYLSFQAPRTSQWVGMVARVSRATQLLTPVGEERRACLVGLVIEEMDPIERSILAASIERLPAVPAKRKAPRDYAAWVAEISGVTELARIHH